MSPYLGPKIHFVRIRLAALSSIDASLTVPENGVKGNCGAKQCGVKSQGPGWRFLKGQSEVTWLCWDCARGAMRFPRAT